MKSYIKSCLIVTFAVTVGAVGSYFLFHDVEEEIPGTSVVKTKTIGAVKKVTKVSIVDNNGKKAIKIVESEQIRPGASVVGMSAQTQPDDIDEEDLTEAQKSALKELQDALDDNDLKKVRKVLSKFIAKVEDGGLGGDVPACMRAKAVAALGWFGKDAAVDLISFLSDSNEEVAGDAGSAMEQALSDCEMGDRERSKIVTSTMQALADSEQIDSLLNQLNDMRNSVKAQAAMTILTSGSDTAKRMMTEQLESYFDEEVQDVDGLKKWQAMNPDDPDDNELYGGSK